MNDCFLAMKINKSFFNNHIDAVFVTVFLKNKTANEQTLGYVSSSHISSFTGTYYNLCL